MVHFPLGQSRSWREIGKWQTWVILILPWHTDLILTDTFSQKLLSVEFSLLSFWLRMDLSILELTLNKKEKKRKTLNHVPCMLFLVLFIHKFITQFPFILCGEAFLLYLLLKRHFFIEKNHQRFESSNKYILHFWFLLLVFLWLGTGSQASSQSADVWGPRTTTHLSFLKQCNWRKKYSLATDFTLLYFMIMMMLCI